MAVDETRRYELHEAARRALGDTPGDTLMEMLPPVGWADVATKQDVVLLKRDIDLLKRDFELQMAALRSEMQAMVLASEHRIIIWMVTTMAAGLAIAVTVARAL
jgi:hypothetical protein